MNLLLFTNILTPYRVHFFDQLYKECKGRDIAFHVCVMAETEPERNWQYSDYKRDYTILLPQRTIKLKDFCIHINREIKKTICKYKPDVVIMAGGYFSPCNMRLLQLQKKYSFKTLFWSESHLNEARDYNRLKLFIREGMRKGIYPKFTGFLYAGELSLQFIRKYSKDTSVCYFLPNLINQDVFDYKNHGNNRTTLRNKYDIDNRFTFICPARLNPVKGIIEFIELVKDSSSVDKLTVLVAGEGILKDKIIRTAEETGVSVKLLGCKDQEDMIELYALSDCFLMPSLSDPNPLTCIEALWSGKPLLISNHVGNYPEVVIENKNGFVFDYNNKTVALNKIDLMVNASRDWLESASQVSYKIANDKYDYNKVVSNLIDFIVRCSNG